MHLKNRLNKYGNKSRKFEVLGTRGIFRIFSSSNYKEVYIKVFTPLPDYFQVISLSITHFLCASQGDVSFVHPKHIV